MSECGRQIDEERNETFPHVRPRASSVCDDVWQETFQTVHAKSRQDLTEALRGALSIDTACV